MSRMQDMVIARIYLTEGQHLLDKLMHYLHDKEKVRGVTVFRGIAGFGPTGKMHEAAIVDLALDLPLVVEFFDTPDRVRAVLAGVETIVKPGHVVTWPVQVLMGD